MCSKCKNWEKKWGIIIILILTIVVSISTIVVGVLLIVKGCIPIGIAVVSTGIAFCSIYLSVQSGERLTTIANAIFMEIVDVFEDKRILLSQHPECLGLEGTIWKCVTYVERAYALHKSTKIDYPNRQRLLKWFKDLIDQVEKYSNANKLEEKHINNIREMINKFKDFKLNEDDLKKLDIIEKTVEEFKTKSSKK